MMNIIWGLTGAGDFLPSVFEEMGEIVTGNKWKITAVLSIAAVRVVRLYRLWETLEKITDNLLVEKDANSPFIVGPIQKGRYKCLLIAPTSSNTVAKIACGIADTLITNAVSQANKANVEIFILPSDQEIGTKTTVLPDGKHLELTIRDLDVENVNKLRKMKGISVLEKPEEIKPILERMINV